MPIGKNAIKRVENNGYSNVKTTAPDMENSSVITKPDEQVVEKLIAPVEQKTAAKKPAAKSTAAKKPATAKPAEAEKKVETAVIANIAPETVAAVIGHKENTGFEKVQVGEKMPVHLL